MHSWAPALRMHPHTVPVASVSCTACGLSNAVTTLQTAVDKALSAQRLHKNLSDFMLCFFSSHRLYETANYNTHLPSINKIQNKIKLFGCLERIVQSNQKRMFYILQEHIAFSHNMFLLERKQNTDLYCIPENNCGERKQAQEKQELLDFTSFLLRTIFFCNTLTA